MNHSPDTGDVKPSGECIRAGKAEGVLSDRSCRGTTSTVRYTPFPPADAVAGLVLRDVHEEIGEQHRFRQEAASYNFV